MKRRDFIVGSIAAAVVPASIASRDVETMDGVIYPAVCVPEPLPDLTEKSIEQLFADIVEQVKPLYVRVDPDRDFWMNRITGRIESAEQLVNRGVSI